MKKYKKQLIIIGIVLALAVFIVYLWALFQPGLWYGDAFLYRQKDGSFKGDDMYAEYKMTVKSAGYGKDIEFSVNDKVKNYQIKYNGVDLHEDVEVIEGGSIIFRGKAFPAGDGWILLDNEHGSSEKIVVHTRNDVPTEEELFPGYAKLYNWAVSDKTDTRGKPYMLFLMIVLGVILFLDIKFPNLFWILEHRLHVDGGEPSDWYLFGQKIGRVVMAILILVCMVMTFTN